MRIIQPGKFTRAGYMIEKIRGSPCFRWGEGVGISDWWTSAQNRNVEFLAKVYLHRIPLSASFVIMKSNKIDPFLS